VATGLSVAARVAVIGVVALAAPAATARSVPGSARAPESTAALVAVQDGAQHAAHLPALYRSAAEVPGVTTVTPHRPLPSATATGTASPTAAAVTATTPPTETAYPVTPTADPGTPPAVRCDSVPTFADGLRPEREIHVAPDGDDAGGDGSPNRPFATIGRAARGAVAGTAVLVHAGTYPGGSYVEGLRGAPGRPIWIAGAPGEARPVIAGGGEGLHLVRPAYVVVEHLEVRGSAANGINVDDGGDVADEAAAHHVVLRRIAVTDVGGSGNQDCLKLSGLRDFVVLDSTFARCGGGGSGSGIDMVGAHRGVIARSRFEATSGNAVQAKGGSSDIEVRWNVMRDAGHRAVNMGGSTGWAYFRPPLRPDVPNAEARDIRVVANVIEGSDTPFAFVGCVGCLAAHNTVVEPARWLLRILQESTSRDGMTFEPARDGVVRSNLFVFRRERLSTSVNVGPGTAPDTFAFAHNLWFALDDPRRSAPDLPAGETGAVVGRDPGLRPDRSIGPGSPAAGAGLSPAPIAGDAGGRCYADPPSIGAFEAAASVLAGGEGCAADPASTASESGSTARSRHADDPSPRSQRPGGLGVVEPGGAWLEL